MERRAEFERETFQELAAVAAACSGMYAAYSAWLNHPASSGLAALIAILLLVVRLGVRPDSGSIHVRVHIALGAALIGIVVAAVTEDAMASLFLACLPLMAAMVAGSRAGIAWGLLCGVVLLSFGLSGLFDFQGRPLWFDALILTGMATLCGLAARKCHDHQSEEINRHCEIAEQHAKTIELGLAEAESARKEAEQAARAKADFLATMSHEIRNPLNGVVAISDMLIATPLNDTQKEYVTVARIACDSLLAIVNDVLDFSKMEAGKLVLQKLGVHLICWLLLPLPGDNCGRFVATTAQSGRDVARPKIRRGLLAHRGLSVPSPNRWSRRYRIFPTNRSARRACESRTLQQPGKSRL